MPTQLVSASKVFIASAGELNNADSAYAYDSFFQHLSGAKRLHPVLIPADADLILELQHVGRVTSVSVTNGGGYSSTSDDLRLTIFDPRSHAILWTLIENVRFATRHATYNSNLDDAVTKLVADLNEITAQQSAPTN